MIMCGGGGGGQFWWPLFNLVGEYINWIEWKWMFYTTTTMTMNITTSSLKLNDDDHVLVWSICFMVYIAIAHFMANWNDFLEEMKKNVQKSKFFLSLCLCVCVFSL